MNKVQCRECGEWFIRLTAFHVQKEHNMTLTEYYNKYGQFCDEKGMLKKASEMFPAREFLIKAMEELSPEEKKDAVIKSDLRVMTQNFTKKAAETYYALLMSRLEMFMKSVEIASRILNDLNHSWRVQMDEDGRPLRIADKIRIGEFATSTMEKISQSFGQILQWAISENKAVIGKPQIAANTIFSGQWDRLPQLIPDPMQREKVRVLTEMMVQKIGQMQNIVQSMETNNGQRPELTGTAPNSFEGSGSTTNIAKSEEGKQS